MTPELPGTLALTRVGIEVLTGMWACTGLVGTSAFTSIFIEHQWITAVSLF